MEDNFQEYVRLRRVQEIKKIEMSVRVVKGKSSSSDLFQGQEENVSFELEGEQSMEILSILG